MCMRRRTNARTANACNDGRCCVGGVVLRHAMPTFLHLMGSPPLLKTLSSNHNDIDAKTPDNDNARINSIGPLASVSKRAHTYMYICAQMHASTYAHARLLKPQLHASVCAFVRVNACTAVQPAAKPDNLTHAFTLINLFCTQEPTRVL